MAFKACFSCELVFEVDEAAVNHCPECGGGLADYQPTSDELASSEPPQPQPDHDDATCMLPSVSVPASTVDDSVSLDRTMALDMVSGALLGSEQPLPALDRKRQEGSGRFGEMSKQADAGLRHTRIEGIPVQRPEAPLAPTSSMPQAPAAAPPVAIQRAATPVARQMTPTDTVRPETRRGLPVKAIYGGAGLLVALLVGGYLMLGGEDAPAAKPAVEAPAEPVGFEARIQRQLEDGQAILPMVEGSEALAEGPFIVGGPDGLSGSDGPVPGLPSSAVPATVVQSDADGEWVRPLQVQLAQHIKKKGGRLVFALDEGVPARSLLRMAYAGQRAGYQTFALAVNQDERPGKLGGLLFGLLGGTKPLPLSGALVVRIGQLGFHVTVRDARRKAISAGQPLLGRRASGRLDLKALAERVSELRAAHPGATLAVIRPKDDMPLHRLAKVMGTLRTAGVGRVVLRLR